jgi:S-adenosylmethionine hydrolase
MKGVILSLNPQARVVDVTHEVQAFDVRAAALALKAAAPWFPPGTVHVVVVDPGVGSSRAPVAAEVDGQLYVGPDNGVLSLAAGPSLRAHRIETRPFVADRPSATFHGRDVFARTAALLAAGTDVGTVGSRLDALMKLELPPTAKLAGGALCGEVIHVDRFGNLITNLSADTVLGADGRPEEQLRVRIGEASLPIVRTFADVAPGEPLAYVGSAGFVEVGVREGRAVDRFACGRGQKVVVRAVRDAA